MRVICCYTELHPRTAEAVRLHAPEAQLVHTTEPYDLYDAVLSRWDGTDDLVVIEQDKVITAEVLPSFARCRRRWCVYDYDVFPPPLTRRIDFGLGCTRFSAQVQSQVPVQEIMGPDDPSWYTCPDCGGSGCRRYLDARIERALRSRRSIRPHVHGTVEHLHHYPPDWRPLAWVTDTRDWKTKS